MTVLSQFLTHFISFFLLAFCIVLPSAYASTRQIFIVSSRADTGAGTLRECVEAKSSRICVFEVGGVIELRSALKISHPNIIIAGETAPSPGITLLYDRVEIKASDVRLSHLRIFPGDRREGSEPSDRDALTILGNDRDPTHNVVLEHSYFGGAIDENVSTYRAVQNIIIRNNIIADSLYQSIHPKGPHGKAMLIGNGAKNIFIQGNLLSGNQDRNPRVKEGSSVWFLNNVVYGWGGESGWNVFNIDNESEKERDPITADIIGNTYLASSDGNCTIPLVYAKHQAPGSRIYLRDNLGPICPQQNAYRKGSKTPSLPLSQNQVNPFPKEFNEKEILPAKESFKEVLQMAGPRPSENDPRETRIIREVLERKPAIKDCVEGCRRSLGAWPTSSSSSHKLSLPQQITESSLEEWLKGFKNKLEQPRAIGSTAGILPE